MRVYSINTGNEKTEAVLKTLAAALGGAQQLSGKEAQESAAVTHFVRGDLVLIGAAAADGRVPDKALGYLTGFQAAGAGAVYVVTEASGDPGDAILELRKSMEDCGFASVAALAAAEAVTAEELAEGAAGVRDKAIYPLAWGDFFVPGRYPYHTPEEYRAEKAQGSGRRSFFASLFGGKKEEAEQKRFCYYR